MCYLGLSSSKGDRFVCGETATTSPSSSSSSSPSLPTSPPTARIACANFPQCSVNPRAMTFTSYLHSSFLSYNPLQSPLLSQARNRSSAVDLHARWTSRAGIAQCLGSAADNHEKHGTSPLEFNSAVSIRWTSELKSSLKKNTILCRTIRGSEGGLGTDSSDSVEENASLSEHGLVGEDAAVFDLSKQKISSWIYFTIILGVVLAILNYIWIDPTTGYGNTFVLAMSSLSDNHEVVMLVILLVFALVHSGLASFRDLGEKLIGERAFRVLFAGLSLPLAVSAVVYFIDHRYDGIQLWQVRDVPGIHELVWSMSFVSFFFLYPSTFNLLEVAAVDKPKMHMYETGIMRITRHPQMVGQFLWCIAHTLWIGNTFMVSTSVGLLAHHLFGVWNGDRRLAIRYGEAFDAVKKRTSIVPFAAILDGRQKLPEDYYKEFLRVPYVVILALTLGAYFSHPLLQAASYHLNW